MTWTIEYGDTAIKQLRKLGQAGGRRILDDMDERIAQLDNPRSTGKALTGPLGDLWRYRVGDDRVVCDRRMMMECMMQETMIETTVSYTIEYQGQLYLIEQVPARVCQETGEEYFSPETMEQIQALIKSGRPPVRVIETPVYRYV